MMLAACILQKNAVKPFPASHGLWLNNGEAQPRKAVKAMVDKICKYVKIDEVLSIDESKPIEQIIAEEYDRMISQDIVLVIKKYFPCSKVTAEDVLILAKSLVNAEKASEAETAAEVVKDIFDELGEYASDFAAGYIDGDQFLQKVYRLRARYAVEVGKLSD